MMPLIMAPIGEVQTIRKITGRDDVRRRLAELGFTIGEEVLVVNRLGDNVILNVRDCRVALDRSMAMRVMV